MVHNIENQVTADFLQPSTQAHTHTHTTRIQCNTTVQSFMRPIRMVSYENVKSSGTSDHWSAGLEVATNRTMI